MTTQREHFGAGVRLVRGIVAGLAATLALAACGGDGSADDPTTVTSDADAETSVAVEGFHPRGLVAKQGERVELPEVTSGEESMTIHVGDTFAVSGEHWSPDNPDDPDELIESTVVLAEVDDDELVYQAVAPGRIVVTVGPVGHPADCDDCADATPPPIVELSIVR